MAITLHANNALGYLLTPVAPGDTTIVLQAGQGALFPTIVPGEQFYVTVENRALAGAMEIMLCTARTLDSLVVTRAQQGTTAKSFAAGVSVSNRVTAAFLNAFDSRIAEAGETADAAAVAAASALASATAANAGLALKANIASPAFTGTPTVPLAAPGTNTDQIASTKFVTAAVAASGGGGGGGAPLDSPAFTGVPTAPTAAPGTNTTQLATTAFVTAAVSSIPGLAPLASPAFTGTPTAPTAAAGTNTTQLATTAYVVAAGALKADVASPTLTGVPAAPTASPGTSTTQIATTAFVTAAVAAGGGGGGGGAPLDSPAFTGVPTAPTATAGTATTQLATTAFVTTAVTQGVSGLAPIAGPTFTGTPAAPTATAGTATTQLATTAFVSSAVGTATSGLAPLASPNFTGTPAAPTAAPGTNTTQVATTAFVTAAITGGDPTKAPLASPAFTGTPTAPTAGAGASSTQLATTAFVTTADNLKANIATPVFTGTPQAPTATAGTSTTQLATTAFVTTADALKANLASPAFTGTPTAPTPAPGVSNTTIATTAFVTAAIGGQVLKVGDTMTGVLQFSGTTHPGLRLNVLTTTQRNGIGAPLGGHIIYNLTTGRYEGYNGTVWSELDFTRASGKTVVFLTPGTPPSDGDVLVASMPSTDGNEFQTRSIPAASMSTSPNTTYGVTAGGAPTARTPTEQVAWELQASTTANSTFGADTLGGPMVQRTPAQQKTVLGDMTGSVTAATTAAAGKVRIATGAETSAGSDATLAVSPDGLAASVFGVKEFGFELCDSATSLTVGDGQTGVCIPFTMNGMLIQGARVACHTAATGTGTNDFQIRRRRAGANTDVLSTKVTLSVGEYTIADGVINAANATLATGDMIYIDRDTISSGPPKGVSFTVTAQPA